MNGMAKISKIIKNDLCLGCGLCEAVSNGIAKWLLRKEDSMNQNDKR